MKKKSVSSLVAGTIAALVLAGCVEQQPVHSSTNVTESSLTNSSSSSEKTVSSSDSVTVYYNVSFDSAGGSAVETQRVESGKTATAPANPVKEATAEYTYTFDGWYLGDTLYDFLTPVTRDIQLVAHWKQVANKYTVSFDSAGGSAVETQRVESGKTATAPANPVKEATAEYSYTFLGWYLGDELYDFASPVTKDIQLVAHWQEAKNKYTVSFVDADGNVLQTSEVEYGQNPKFTGETPTKASTAQYHYDFKGWFDEQGNELTDATIVVAAATYHPEFTSVVNQYTITYHYKNAEGATTSSETLDYGSTLTPPETTYTTTEGHIASTDGKWYTDETCATEADVTAIVSANLDLYAKYNAVMEHPFAVNTKQNGYSTASLVQMGGLNLNAPSSAFSSDVVQLDLLNGNYSFAGTFSYNGEAFTPAGVILHDNGTFQFNFPTRTNVQGDVIKVNAGLEFTIENIHYSLSKDVEFYFNGTNWRVVTGHVDFAYHWGDAQYNVLMLKGANGVDDFSLSYTAETALDSASHLTLEKNGVADSAATFSYLVDSPENGGTPLIKISATFQSGDYLTLKGGSYFTDGNSSYLIDHDITLHYVGGEGKGAFVPSTLAKVAATGVETGEATKVIVDIALPALEGKTLTNQSFTLAGESKTASSMTYADGKLTITLPEAASDGAMLSLPEGMRFEADGIASVYFLQSDYVVRYLASSGWVVYEVTPFTITSYHDSASNYLQFNQTFDFEGFSDGNSLDVSKASFAVNGEDKNDVGINVQYFTSGIISITFGSYTPAASDILTIKAGSIFTDGKKDYSLKEDCNVRYNGSKWAILTYVDSMQYRWGDSGHLQYNFTQLSWNCTDGETLDITSVQMEVNGTAQAVASIQYFLQGILSINFGNSYAPQTDDVFSIKAGSVFVWGNFCFALQNTISSKYNGSSWVAA